MCSTSIWEDGEMEAIKALDEGKRIGPDPDKRRRREMLADRARPDDPTDPTTRRSLCARKMA